MKGMQTITLYTKVAEFFRKRIQSLREMAELAVVFLYQALVLGESVASVT